MDQKSAGAKMWTGEGRLGLSERTIAQRNLVCGPE